MFIVSSDPPALPLDQNIPCLRCGYNLRTLSSDARCPECSAAIAASLSPNLLRFADPSWTSILALAMGIMLISTSIELVFVIVSLFLAESETILSIFQLFEPIHSFVNPLFWLAVFLLGRANPHPPSSPRRFTFRRAMRIAALVALFSAIVSESSSLDLWLDFPDYLTEFPLAHVIELLATILLFLYLLQLARRTGQPSLLRHTRIAMIAMIFALCVWAFLDIYSDRNWAEQINVPARLLLIPIFIYQLYVFFRFRRTLRNCATFARQYWHFCSPIPTVGSASADAPEGMLYEPLL